MQVEKGKIYIKGKPLTVDVVKVYNKIIIIKGKLVKIARIKEEWYEDVEDPDTIIHALKNAAAKPDMFTFWQRLPETTPKYDYYKEWQSVSAIPIISYEHWWEKQIHPESRKNTKKSIKKGVSTRLVDLNDDFIKGVTSIYNESRIRRGKPFWHYGKDFDTVKKELSKDAYKSDFIGAYYNDQLIGFYQLLYDGRLAHPVLSLSTFKHRDKKTDDALIAKAVEVCHGRGIAFLMYGAWRRGSHAEFLQRHGFEKIDVPRYYVPLTIKGRILLALKLHRGIGGMLPEKIKTWLLKLRAKWYQMKYSNEVE